MTCNMKAVSSYWGHLKLSLKVAGVGQHQRQKNPALGLASNSVSVVLPVYLWYRRWLLFIKEYNLLIKAVEVKGHHVSETEGTGKPKLLFCSC